jgi:hypothetical protein
VWADAGRGENDEVRDKKLERTRWYGWQTLIVDSGTLLLTAVAAGSGGGGGQTVFLSGYLLGGPIVHAAHGNWAKAGGSLALRAGLPVAGAYLGAGAQNCSQSGGDMCGLGGALTGIAVGGLAAIVIDAALLAHDTVPTSERRVDKASIRITPMLGHAEAPKGLQVAGVF